MGDGARKGLFVHQVLSFMDPGFKSKDFQILVDNQDAIRLETNPHSSARLGAHRNPSSWAARADLPEEGEDRPRRVRASTRHVDKTAGDESF